MNEKPPFNLVESFTLAPGLTQPDSQAEADRARAAALLAKAGEDADRTRRTAAAELDRARAEAQRIRDEVAADDARKKKRAGDLDVWAARVVIAGAVGLTASGEYSLALMVGFAPLSAWLLPLVIDVYVIQAFRRHRDIPPAIGLTIAANVIYHLAAVGLFGLTPSGKPQWWLIAVVASVASLILWRMHLMIAPPRARNGWRARRAAARKAAQRRRFTICSGSTGLLSIRLPKPIPAPPPFEPAGPVGSPVDDVDLLLEGQHAPIVYLVRNGSRVKIGTSRNLQRRIGQLCLRADDIELVLHGDAIFERHLHEKFSASRINNTEWFQRHGVVAKFIANRGQDAPEPEFAGAVAVASGSIETPAPVANSELSTGDNSMDNASTTVAPPVANASDKNTASEPAKRPMPRRQKPPSAGAKKTPARRSLDEWVEVAGPIFHAEFARLRRNPTANEFATAIKVARLGDVSDSTAKNIRAEILDRTELPALDGEG